MANKAENKQAPADPVSNNSASGASTDYGKVGGVEDAEQRFRDETNDQDKKDAKQQEKAIESAVGGTANSPTVHVRTQDEIENNQKSATNDAREFAVDQTNRGLRDDTRPGAGDGNGKTYKDERIQPSDTNAPDAGLLPDGTRVAS